jgi:hypothetical protein
LAITVNTQAFVKNMKRIYCSVKKKLKMKHFSVVKNVVWLLQAHGSTVTYVGIVFQMLYASFIYLYSKKQQCW